MKGADWFIISPAGTDSTIVPQKKSAILFNVSWLLDTRKGTIENKVVGKGLLIDDVGVSRDTVSQEIRPGADFETGDLVKEKGVGGATVERLPELYGSATSPGGGGNRSDQNGEAVFSRDSLSDRNIVFGGLWRLFIFDKSE